MISKFKYHKMRKIKLIILALCCFLCLTEAWGQQKDKLLQLLKQELNYNLQELKKQELPPYYMNFRVIDDRNITVKTSFGAVMGILEQKSRQFIPQIRVGDTELDNFKKNVMGTWKDRNGNYPAAFLPIEDDGAETAARQAIWAEVLKRYDFAVNSYEAAKAQSSVNVEDEDQAPCFSSAPVEKYYEAPIAEDKQQVDVAAWEKRLEEISAVFKSSPLLLSGDASLSYKIQRTYLVDSEGSEVVQNRTYARIVVTAKMKAGDGMELPLNLSYFAYELKDLPSNEKMVADARDIVKRLTLLRKAPVANPYTGPALLSGPASGVFFHEIFGHRIEGQRMKSGGQTFKKMVGEQVLPADFQVYCDPTLREYAGEDLNGHYVYDDQGVKACRVDVVQDGILREFLMSRVPIDSFPHSNGHGRTAGGADPVSRQSNLVVETKQPKTEAELRVLLIEEAKKQEKEYGYYFKEVTSGFTYTGEGGSLNSFNVTPLEVYRIYVDGRPDELVRGVDLIGTPLSMFSNIVCAGDRPSVFTGMCGAESGWVPVTASSPMILVNKIETQRRAKSQDIPPILQAPAVNAEK